MESRPQSDLHNGHTQLQQSVTKLQPVPLPALPPTLCSAFDDSRKVQELDVGTFVLGSKREEGKTRLGHLREGPAWTQDTYNRPITQGCGERGCQLQPSLTSSPSPPSTDHILGAEEHGEGSGILLLHSTHH